MLPILQISKPSISPGLWTYFPHHLRSAHLFSKVAKEAHCSLDGPKKHVEKEAVVISNIYLTWQVSYIPIKSLDVSHVV